MMESNQGRASPSHADNKVVNRRRNDTSNEPLVINGDTGHYQTGSDKPKLLEDREDDEAVRQKFKNLIKATLGISFTMIAYCVFDDTYTQWLYVRFEQDVLGSNFSKINVSTSDNPCLQNNISSSLKNQLNEAQSQASQFVSWSMLAGLGPAVFTCTVLGAYSDRIGRKVFFVMPATGYAIRQGMALVVAHWQLDMRYLYIGLVVEGVSGSMGATFIGAYLYAADNTSKKKSRSLGMVLMQATASLFYALTHLGVGYFITNLGYFWPMATGTCLTLSTVVWYVFVVPETLQKPEKFRTFKEGVQSLVDTFLVKIDNPKYKRGDFIVIIVSFFIWGFTIGAQFQTLFLMNQPLCWGSKRISYAFTYKGVIQALGSLVGMPLLQRIMSDGTICAVGLFSGMASRLTLAFATKDFLVYVGYGLSLFEVVVFPIMRAIVSRMLPFEKRGSAFASLGILEVTTVAISGVGVNDLYSATVALWPGLAFSFVGGCVFIAAILMTGYTIVSRQRTDKELLINVEAENCDDAADEKPLIP